GASHDLRGGGGDDLHEVVAVGLGQAHPDVVARVGGQVLADRVGPDGQLAVAPVDQHGELDGPGPAEVGEGVEGGPDGAAREEHVVDEHHHAVGDVDRHL